MLTFSVRCFRPPSSPAYNHSTIKPHPNKLTSPPSSTPLLSRPSIARKSSITFIILLPSLLPWMPHHRPRRMILLPKATPKRIANYLLPFIHNHTRTMMSVNTKLELAILPIQTRIQPRQISNSFQVFLCGFVLVLEAAFIAFGAGPA